MRLYSQTLRLFSKAPGFSVMVVLTLGLGIAATTALFSVVDTVLLQPLALLEAGRIVAINTVWPVKGTATPRMTGGDFLDLRSAVHGLSNMTIYSGGEIGVRLPEQTRFAQTFVADPAFFRVLKIKPALGRLPDDRSSIPTAMLTTAFARAGFGDAARALGQAIIVDHKPYQVVGLVQDNLAFPEKADVWITGPLDPENQNRTAFNYYAVGRLRNGVSEAQFQAELSTIGALTAAAHPNSNAGKTFRAIPLQEQVTAPVRTTLWFLFGASGLLLLIACANVANLMLARAVTRTREMAIRVSLGSGAARIFQLLLAESVLLGCAAAVLGVVLASLALRAIYPLIPASVPNAANVLHFRPSVLVFAALTSFLTVVLCTAVPALRLGQANLADMLKQSSTRGVVEGSGRVRDLIIVLQIATCCLLCVGAALLSRTLIALDQAPLGFRSEGVLVAYAHEPAEGLPQYRQAIRTFERVLERLRLMNEVRSAAAVMGLPTGQYGSNGSYLVQGIHIQPGQDPFKTNQTRELPEASFALASSKYFESVGIRLLNGRDFNERDQYDAPFTAIISQSLARQSFGSSNPIGRRIFCGLDSPRPMTIVGLVSDVRQKSPASALEPEIYMPFQQHPFYANELQLTVRTNGDAMRIVPDVRRIISHLAPSLALRFTTFSEMVQDSISAPRFRAELALSFALLAMTLAISGVYGLMSYYVAERTVEMGLRMALGASRSSIVGLVSGRAFVLAAIGLVTGILGAVTLSRLLTSLLYGVGELDIPMYAAGALMVLLVVMLAASLPSWRASRVDPATALRAS